MKTKPSEFADTAERVKRHPRPWEQNLLTLARCNGEQADVDRAAELIARFNRRNVARREEHLRAWLQGDHFDRLLMREEQDYAEYSLRMSIIMDPVFDNVSGEVKP